MVQVVKQAAPKSKKALKAAAKAVLKASKRAVKQPPKKAYADVYAGVSLVWCLCTATQLRSVGPRHHYTHCCRWQPLCS